MYGLPEAAFYLVGALKISAGAVLLRGLSSPPRPTRGGVVAVLMIGAITMHLKGGDPLIRSRPTAAMLLMSLGIVILS